MIRENQKCKVQRTNPGQAMNVRELSMVLLTTAQTSLDGFYAALKIMLTLLSVKALSRYKYL